MAVVVGFISEKGGVGKTTACYHIAVALSRYHSRRVLVIDADYQRGGISGRFKPKLIEQFGKTPVAGETLFHKFQQLYSASPQTLNVDLVKCSDGIDLMPADWRMSTISADKLPATNNIRGNNAQLLKHLQVISGVTAAISSNYDYVLIDSHPEVSDLLKAIIYASDYCVSPVKLDRQSSIGVASVSGEIENVNADVAVIASMLQGGIFYKPTKFAGAMGMMAREYAEDLKQSEMSEYNRLSIAGDVFENYVTEGDGIRQAAAQRVSVYDIPISNAVKQSQQFKNLTSEFIKRCS